MMFLFKMSVYITLISGFSIGIFGGIFTRRDYVQGLINKVVSNEHME